MREIKFQVFHKEANEMLCEHRSMHGIYHYLNNPKYGVRQFTGLKDKNGTDIYEGDIIFIYDDEETEEGWWENVFFHQGAFMAGDEDLLCTVHFRSKVIGNKYEKLQP